MTDRISKFNWFSEQGLCMGHFWICLLDLNITSGNETTRVGKLEKKIKTCTLQMGWEGGGGGGGGGTPNGNFDGGTSHHICCALILI